MCFKERIPLGRFDIEIRAHEQRYIRKLGDHPFGEGERLVIGRVGDGALGDNVQGSLEIIDDYRPVGRTVIRMYIAAVTMRPLAWSGRAMAPSPQAVSTIVAAGDRLPAL